MGEGAGQTACYPRTNRGLISFKHRLGSLQGALPYGSPPAILPRSGDGGVRRALGSSMLEGPVGGKSIRRERGNGQGSVSKTGLK